MGVLETTDLAGFSTVAVFTMVSLSLILNEDIQQKVKYIQVGLNNPKDRQPYKNSSQTK